jgi:hypothetical protein
MQGKKIYFSFLRNKFAERDAIFYKVSVSPSRQMLGEYFRQIKVTSHEGS